MPWTASLTDSESTERTWTLCDASSAVQRKVRGDTATAARLDGREADAVLRD